MGKHYKFLNKDFSDRYISMFRLLYDEMEKSGVRKEAHLKWILRPEHLVDHYVKKFPWIKTLPDFNYEKETLVFFRMNPTWENGNHFHIHLDPLEANANINIPIYNCTSDVVTTWVEPIGKQESIVEERAGNKVVKGETEVEFLTSNHKILEEANLVGDRCCLFKGDVWHKVDVLHKRNETRVMSKIWSRGLVWKEMLKKYEDFIDDSFSPT